MKIFKDIRGQQMNLKEQLDKINKERNQIIDLIEKQELEKKLPILKKKYEGKYFKCKNSYSASDEWYLYSHCAKITNLHEALVNSFQTTSLGKSKFETRDTYYDSLFEIEITKKEYQKALADFKKRLNKLG
jgi:hypothetical protein